MPKKFLYLIQCEGTQFPYPELQSSTTADIIGLSYQEKRKDMLFLPNSTWTQGRNHLLAHAKKLPQQYEYYIFLDDDVEFIKGNWGEYEQFLSKYQPAIGTLPFEEHDLSTRSVVYGFDAIVSGFHRSVVFDDAVLPYQTIFDDQSWWFSQYILFNLTTLFYSGYVIQHNAMLIKNTQHRAYPRPKMGRIGRIYASVNLPLSTIGMKKRYPGQGFRRVDKWISKQLLNSCKCYILISRIKHLYYKTSKLPPAKADYTVPESTKQKYFRNYGQNK